MPLFDIEKKLIDCQNEYLLFLNSDGTLRECVKGGPSGVSDIPFKTRFENMDCIMSHNHPKGLSHSMPDIEYTIVYRMISSRVVTKNKLFIVEMPARGWDINEWQRYQRGCLPPIVFEETGYHCGIINNTWNFKLDPDMPEGYEDTEECKIAWERIWPKLFEEYGAEYTIEKI